MAIANREALIRVVVTADAGQVDLKAPVLNLTLTNQDTGAIVLQTTLRPASNTMVLPTSGEASDAIRGNQTVPDLYRSYLFSLPADKLPAASLLLRAEIDTQASGLNDTVFADNGKIVNLKPVAVPALKLVTVPIHVSGTVPTMPSADTLKKVVKTYLPVSEVQIQQREPYVVADSVLGGVEPENYPEGTYQALLRIGSFNTGRFFSLPDVDNSSGQIYVGFVKGNVGGIANAPNAILAAANYGSVLPHEILHTLGFQHQHICGAGFEYDPNYPYANGGHNGTWGIEFKDESSIILKEPNKNKSIMGYCSPSYTSDYHIAGFIDRFLNNYSK